MATIKILLKKPHNEAIQLTVTRREIAAGNGN